MKNTMEVNTEKQVQSFKKAFEAAPAWLQTALRIKIMYRCGWESRTTFYNKMNGETPIKRPEAAVIALIFAGFKIDAWTGEELEIINNNDN